MPQRVCCHHGRLLSLPGSLQPLKEQYSSVHIRISIELVWNCGKHQRHNRFKNVMFMQFESSKIIFIFKLVFIQILRKSSVKRNALFGGNWLRSNTQLLASLTQNLKFSLIFRTCEMMILYILYEYFLQIQISLSIG